MTHMTLQMAREVIAQALESAGTVRAFRAHRDAFLAGQDVRLDELDIDSLGAMELCIAIELETGVEIVPEDLAKWTSLADLVAAIARGAP